MRHQTTLLKAVASFIRASVGHGDAGRKSRDISLPKPNFFSLTVKS